MMAFVYHGPDAAIDGGLTDMAYMPEYGVAYFFSINSDSGDAFEKITHAIRPYITHNLQKPPVPPPAQLPAYAADYFGWYEPDSPAQNSHIFWHACMDSPGLSSKMANSSCPPLWAGERSIFCR